MVGKISVKVVASGEKRPPRGIPSVVCKAFVVANGASNLACLVVATKGCTSRNTHCTVELYAIFHQHIDDACGEQAPHSASFQYQSCLHLLLFYRL